MCGMISIHTPAQGVTAEVFPSRLKKANFNPHSRTGSDVGNGTLWYAGFPYFNPPPRTGSDGSEYTLFDKPLDISIHTPAQGVTII